MDTRILRFAIIALLIASCTSVTTKDVTNPVIKAKDNPLSAADSAAVKKLDAQTRGREAERPDSSIYVRMMKRKIAEQAGNKQMVMDYYVEVSEIYLNYKRDRKLGKTYADSALWFAEQKGNEWLKYEAYNCLGNYYVDVNDSLASSYLLKSLKMQPSPVDSVVFVNIHILLAILAKDQGNDDAAMEFYEPVIHYFENQPPTTFQVITFSNGYSFANKSTKKGLTRARQYLFKAKQLVESMSDTLAANLVYHNLADYYSRAEEFNIPYKEDSILFFVEKAMEHTQSVPQFSDAAPPFIKSATIYLKKGDVAKARRIVDRLESHAEYMGFDKKQVEADYFQVKYELLKQEGNTAGALAALEKRGKLEEEINKIKKDEQLLNHQKELRKLAAENVIAAKSSLIEKQHLQATGLVIFCVLLAMLIVLVYLYWRNKGKLERERLLDIQRQKEFESQKKLFEERSRIASEMHDDLGSTLTSAIMAVELIKHKPDDPSLLTMIHRTAHQLSDQINEIIWNMNVQNDNLENLSDYMICFAAGFLKDANIQFTWNEDLKGHNVPVDGQQRRAIYLCVKELINNAVKHSKATQIQLDIAFENGVLTIDIADNGIGLQNSAPTGSGNGLVNIKKRIYSLNGDIEWKDEKPGTRVHFDVPL